MTKKSYVLLPHVTRLLDTLGENIRLARLRRRFSASIVAQRAGIARNTLRAVERGDPNVAFGAYVSVLHSLGLVQDLSLVARDDELGRKLQDIGLTVKERAPKIARKKDKSHE
jgi:transcriptional regulator with XRE-family HTH domain